MKDLDPDRQAFRDKWVLIVLVVATIACIAASQCGCNGQSVKPSNELKKSVDQVAKTAQETRAELKQAVDTIMGSLTNITTNITNSVNKFVSTMTTDFKQEMETYQGSMRDEIGEVKGDIRKEIKTATNTTWYGLGLVGFVLIFLLIRELLEAWVEKGSTIKNFGARLFKAAPRKGNGE